MEIFGDGGGDWDEEAQRAAAAEALAAIERRVDRLLEFLDVPLDSVDSRPELSERVLHWLSRGSLIHAIKAYREETGVGLKEAKEAVEGTGTATPTVRIARKLDAVLERLGVPAAGDVDGDGDDAPDDPLAGETVDSLLTQDRVMEAIKLYRQQTGAGLADAKWAVEERRRELRGPGG